MFKMLVLVVFTLVISMYSFATLLSFPSTFTGRVCPKTVGLEGEKGGLNNASPVLRLYPKVFRIGGGPHTTSHESHDVPPVSRTF